MEHFIITIVVAYVLFTGALYGMQRNLLYYPDRTRPDVEVAGVPEMREVTLETEDGLALLAWYKAAEPGHPTVVYFCGNAGNIGHRGSKVRHYLDAGMGVLLVSYRGYGGNPGKPTEEGLYADGRAALAFLADQGVAPARVVAYGESLGAGIAVQMALEQAAKAPLGTLVLEAPFASLADVAAKHYPFVPVRWLLKDRFESDAKIARVRAPVFILHGEKDRVVPVSAGRALFAAAVEPKDSLWLADRHHNDLYFTDEAPRAVIAFIEHHLGRRLAMPARSGGTRETRANPQNP